MTSINFVGLEPFNIFTERLEKQLEKDIRNRNFKNTNETMLLLEKLSYIERIIKNNHTDMYVAMVPTSFFENSVPVCLYHDLKQNSYHSVFFTKEESNLKGLSF